MFKDESHIISLLAALSIGTITKTSLRESIVFLISCSLKIGFTDLDVILFLRVRICSFTHDTAWLFHSEKWCLWTPLSFDILSLN